MEPAHVPAAADENQLLACLLKLEGASPEDQLTQVNLLRQGLLNGLIRDTGILKDASLLTALKGLAKDIDSSNLGRMRLMQEKDDSDENASIQRSYIALMQRYGGSIPKPTMVDIDRDLSPTIDSSEFSSIEGETKIGNDIKDDG
jgi:hypothetical protein